MATDRSKNSFDLLRVVFAVFVLFTHSYPIVGLPDTDFLSQISKGTYYLSSIAVPGFFIISGYLVIQSLQQSPNASTYLLKRFARIYPGLFVMLLLTVSLGWVVYEGSFRQYITDPGIYIYFFKNLLMTHKHMVYGFFAGNPAESIINVSIWSIPYEVLFYLMLTGLFKVPVQRHTFISFALYAFLVCNFIFTYYHIGIPNLNFQNITTHNIFRYGSFFFAGVYLGTISHWLQANRRLLLVVSGFLLAAVIFAALPFYCLNLVLPIAVISLGLTASPDWVTALFRKMGDPSYGVYIYGFPVQQTLYYYFKPNYWQHVCLSVVVTIIMGICSWNFVEKPALLLLKNRLAKRERNNI